MSRRQRGAALAVTLILLGGLGMLALTAAAAAIAALALTGHQQSAQAAFEAAEAGVAHALEYAAAARAEGEIASEAPSADGDTPPAFESRITRVDLPGSLPAGFSIGGHADGFAAQHYFIVSDGRAERGVAVRIEQGFYLVVPGTLP